MAYSPNTTNLFRRRALVRFFAGIAGAIIAGRAAGVAAASTPGCPEPDAQLFARWREYLNSEIELNAAQDARDLVSWNARQAYPRTASLPAGRRIFRPRSMPIWSYGLL